MIQTRENGLINVENDPLNYDIEKNFGLFFVKALVYIVDTYV